MKNFNIVVFILDSLRADHISCYGYHRDVSPNIDRLAQRAVLFENAITCATHSPPSHTTMLSGLYLAEHQFEGIEPDHTLNPSILLLPSILQKAGYVTALFSQNPFVGQKTGLDKYFDQTFTYWELINNRVVSFPNHIINSIIRRSFLFDQIDLIGELDTTSETLSELLKWINSIDTHKNNFFVLVNLMDIHTPYHPSLKSLNRFRRFRLRETRETYKNIDAFHHTSGLFHVSEEKRSAWIDLYDSSIFDIDKKIGYFFRKLPQTLTNNTVFFLLSDHGEMLGEHKGLVGHGFCLYEELIHIPLIIIHPDFHSGYKVSEAVETRHIFETVLHISGIDLDLWPYKQVKKNYSLLDIIHHREITNLNNDKFVFSEYGGENTDKPRLLKVNPEFNDLSIVESRVAVRTQSAKYIWHKNGEDELYDLESDPSESKNQICEEVDKIKTYKQALETWRKSLSKFSLARIENSIEHEELLEERLRNLGYLF